MRRAFALAVAIHFASGTLDVAPRQAEASERPEITIPNTQSSKIKALLISKMIARGYTLVKDEDYRVTFEKPTGSFAGNFLMGLFAGGAHVLQANFELVETASGTNVSADLLIISRAGIASGPRADVSRSAASPDVQKFLDELAAAASPTQNDRR